MRVNEILDVLYGALQREGTGPQDKACGVTFPCRGFPVTRISTERLMTESTKRPAFDAFMVDGDGKDAFWTKIGAAWAHEDGKGFNLQLAAIPINGRVALREPKPRDEKVEAKPEPKSRESKK